MKVGIRGKKHTAHPIFDFFKGFIVGYIKHEYCCCCSTIIHWCLLYSRLIFLCLIISMVMMMIIIIMMIMMIKRMRRIINQRAEALLTSSIPDLEFQFDTFYHTNFMVSLLNLCSLCIYSDVHPSL